MGSSRVSSEQETQMGTLFYISSNSDMTLLIRLRLVHHVYLVTAVSIPMPSGFANIQKSAVFSGGFVLTGFCCFLYSFGVFFKFLAVFSALNYLIYNTFQPWVRVVCVKPQIIWLSCRKVVKMPNKCCVRQCKSNYNVGENSCFFFLKMWKNASYGKKAFLETIW